MIPLWVIVFRIVRVTAIELYKTLLGQINPISEVEYEPVNRNLTGKKYYEDSHFGQFM